MQTLSCGRAYPHLLIQASIGVASASEDCHLINSSITCGEEVDGGDLKEVMLCKKTLVDGILFLIIGVRHQIQMVPVDVVFCNSRLGMRFKWIYWKAKKEN